MEFEPRLEHAVRKWQQLTPWQRRFFTLDSLAAEAGLLPEEFFGAISRASFRTATRQRLGLQQDRVKRIPQVMRDDAEHVIPQLRGTD